MASSASPSCAFVSQLDFAVLSLSTMAQPEGLALGSPAMQAGLRPSWCGSLSLIRDFELGAWLDLDLGGFAPMSWWRNVVKSGFRSANQSAREPNASLSCESVGQWCAALDLHLVHLSRHIDGKYPSTVWYGVVLGVRPAKT